MHENNGKPEALLWIDFETTGVDRRKSLPLEIGMECTDMLGEQKFGSLSRIIRPDRLDLLSMSPVAFSMHTDNGLLFELMGGSVRNDSMVVVANAVEEFLDSLSQRFSLVPAGTNVDFDLDFLRRLNLNPDAWLTYRKYDMATIRRLVTVLGAPDPYQGDSGPHRVKSCIARDIALGTGGFSGFGVGGRWQATSSTMASRDNDRIRMRMAVLRGGRSRSVASPATPCRERVSLRHRNTAGAAPEDT